ncbi:hypothetical protein [Dokdonella soli]|uniref:hypothetical protein n=1 Tax=Dokdonella soli TaxID=529810 RepID=UPI0031D535EF
MSNARIASATVVLPWMISSTNADLRRAVHRLISSSITALIGVSFFKGYTGAGFHWVIYIHAFGLRHELRLAQTRNLRRQCSDFVFLCAIARSRHSVVVRTGMV